MPDSLDWSDAVSVAFMLVALERAIPPHQWVDAIVEHRRAVALERLF